ncbi:RNA polymerase sigma-70 factor (ECF subfamily) [Actinoplanes octamycinicus]|uniref:RNA polymerase sigma-70 factor (ECF subfamily) n=1 Tax=Actinoplanes octamycinicus TaxID=135948 RepID=A0A7W7MBD6_9ACTN|nr:RNA polymerase sigma factor SigJ [Actinoplanes octamycinicus]MBB4743730.1 RNA polymerase sigma-70 factor (ECF subfamily) [Actinoplanes octamycinicus]GIE61160.1 RNA polymerase sigma24 factor [Actinoplanes octamycinicus]
MNPENERGQLINVAYRLLGSLADAEDVVQETYARWFAMSAADQAAIDVPGAWLTKVASRICLDQLRSARVRRERYVGEWIPEPVPEPDGADPADRITLDESVSMAFLVVLDAMTPAERVAFVLHDVFRFAFAEVAEVTGRSAAACRQLASSARRRVAAARPAAAPAAGIAAGKAAEQARVVRDFKLAWEAKNIEALVGLLDPDATVVADGGGLVTAALHPIEGREQVARFAVALAERVPGLRLVEGAVNGEPGLITQHDGVTTGVIAFEVDGPRITRIWAVRNPEKLRPWI